MATGNGHDNELLLPKTNHAAPTPLPRCRRHSGQHARQARMERRRAAHLSSPTQVEAGLSQPGVVAEDVTASSPPTAATMPPKEGAAEPPPFPFGVHTPAATHASSVNTSMSTHEDLPGHHLVSIRNLTAPPPSSCPTPRMRGTSSYVITLPRSSLVSVDGP